MTGLDIKLNIFFGGKVVRKDLTNLVKGNAVVPTYVLEYLLGQYCATDDEETIKEGVETVKSIIAKHFVHRDEAQLIKSTVRESGSHRIIDKVMVQLNDKKDVYEASFANLGLNKVVIDDEYVRNHPKLLGGGGVWCIATLGYVPGDDREGAAWLIEQLKPIQMSGIDVEEYKKGRKEFSRDEWVDILMRSIGLNPDEFTFRSKLLQLSRLIPFAENNYNLIELGPKGTGKSHIFSEMSPHGILISGGEVSKAKLFVNNSNGEIGLVGYWDVVAYDEFAGKTKRTDKGLVDIMKNYMANRSFSRGTQVYGASASMVFVGNTDRSVPYMLNHSDLFEALPKDYYDTAFLDRIHCYLPGWEVQKLRNEMFTTDYGFITDYIAEILKELRKEDHTHDYQKYFELSDSITKRDRDSISKTYSGLMKVIYPHGEISESEARELLEFAIEGRKRVKLQLMKMDETFGEDVQFIYTSKSNGQQRVVETLEIVEHQGHKRTEIESHETDSGNDPEQEIGVKTQLEAGQKIIRDNQSGITYDELFGDYLNGATDVKIIDPYVRLPYQMKNFMEFAKLLASRKPFDQEVRLHLRTYNDEEHLQFSHETFKEMSESLIGQGIIFNYELDPNAHDRSITLNNGWKIILGRGLDMYQRSSGRWDLGEFDQSKRQCKGCEITYLKE